MASGHSWGGSCEEEERWKEEGGKEEDGEESNTLRRAKCPDSRRSRRVVPLQAWQMDRQGYAPLDGSGCGRQRDSPAWGRAHTPTQQTHEHLYKHREILTHCETKKTPDCSDTSAGQRRICIVSHWTRIFAFVLVQSGFVPERARVVWGHLSGRIKVNQVQRFYFFHSRRCSKPQGVSGHRLICRSARLCFSTHMGHGGQCRPRCEKCNEACGGRKEMGGEFNQSWPSARLLVTPKVLFPCEISGNWECGTHAMTQISCSVSCRAARWILHLTVQN